MGMAGLGDRGVTLHVCMLLLCSWSTFFICSYKAESTNCCTTQLLYSGPLCTLIVQKNRSECIVGQSTVAESCRESLILPFSCTGV
jgi:hypothetical protein